MAVPVVARAQAVIKVNDDVNFKLGVLGQFQADWLEDPATDETTQNLFIRRIRLLFGGQVAKNVTLFVETDAPNLGKVLPGGTNISPAVNVQDAYGEFLLHHALAIDAGLMFVPFSRNSLQSAASLLPIDYGAYTFTQTGPTESIVGRDTGFQAKGQLLTNRLEYRLGAFQGARDPSSRRAFRYAGRVQYELLDSEGTGFFYTGTYLGTKKVAAIGAAFDAQDEYHAFDADAFVDYPSGPDHRAICLQPVRWRRHVRDASAAACGVARDRLLRPCLEADTGPASHAARDRRRRNRRRNSLVGWRELLVGGAQRQHQGGVRKDQPCRTWRSK